MIGILFHSVCHLAKSAKISFRHIELISEKVYYILRTVHSFRRAKKMRESVRKKYLRARARGNDDLIRQPTYFFLYLFFEVNLLMNRCHSAGEDCSELDVFRLFLSPICDKICRFRSQKMNIFVGNVTIMLLLPIDWLYPLYAIYSIMCM